MVDSRFIIFVSIKRFIVQLVLVFSITFAIQPAKAQKNEHLTEVLRLSSHQAEMLGLERKAFDFKSPKLNFSTFIPKGAELSLQSYEDKKIDDGQIGRVLPLGQVIFTQDGVEIEDKIFAYKLRYVPAALRICQWQMQKDAYFIYHSAAKDMIAEAELFGIEFQGENKTPSKAQFAYCYVRGDSLIAHFFSTPLVADPQQQSKRVDVLRKAVSYFTSNIIMADDKVNAVDDNLMQNSAINVDGETLILKYPKGLEVVVDNSARKILPYEYHLVQKLQDKAIFSHLFLWINKASEPESEESFRRQADIFAEIYIASQIYENKETDSASSANNAATTADGSSSSNSSVQDTRNKIKFEFIARNSIPGFAEAGIMARSYRYKIFDIDNPKHSTMFLVSVIGYRDKTYVLYYHNVRSGISLPSEYFTGLAGDVAYDTIRASLFDYLVSLK